MALFPSSTSLLSKEEEQEKEGEEEKEKTPLKIGVRCSPPALTLLYREGHKKRVRVMPVRFLNKFGAVDHVTKNLKGHHESFLSKVPDIRIEKMLKILQKTKQGLTIQEASRSVCDDFKIDPEQDLNKLSDAELAKKKMIMEASFLENQLKDGDEGYEYDLQIDFEHEDKIDAGWDSEADVETI